MKKLLVLACALAAVTAAAHSVSREEVLAFLNADHEVIRGASSSDKLPELLVIEVTDAWTKLPADYRREAARNWLAMWRHAIARGRVSVVNKAGEPVVHYRASGEIDIGERASRP